MLPKIDLTKLSAKQIDCLTRAVRRENARILKARRRGRPAYPLLSWLTKGRLG